MNNATLNNNIATLTAAEVTALIKGWGYTAADTNCEETSRSIYCDLLDHLIENGIVSEGFDLCAEAVDNCASNI